MRRILALICAAALLWVTVGGTMSKADAEYVTSPMSGVLIGPDGQAAGGVTVRRTWDWRGKSGEDRTVTDASGQFAFDGVPAKRGFFQRLAAEDAVRTVFYADYPAGAQNFLVMTPRVGPENHENKGAPISVTCDLRKEPAHGGFWFGVCTLD
ncbi:MAG: DUF6795 domain-containing protein [Pseudomonadota bacterium]